MEFRANALQLQCQISAGMVSNTGFDQALTGIITLSNLAMDGDADEVTKIHTVLTVSKLLQIRCSNDEVIRLLLILLTTLTSRDLARDPHATPPQSVLFEQVIDTMKSMLTATTSYSKAPARTAHTLNALHIVGMGCIWARHNDLFKYIVETINSYRSGGGELAELCRNAVDELEKSAAEDSDDPTKRQKMLSVPLIDKDTSYAGHALFYGII